MDQKHIVDILKDIRMNTGIYDKIMDALENDKNFKPWLREPVSEVILNTVIDYVNNDKKLKKEHNESLCEAFCGKIKSYIPKH